MSRAGDPPTDGRSGKRRRSWRRLGLLALVLLVLVATGSLVMFHMPGTSHRGPLPPPSDDEQTLAVALRRDVEALGTIGPRNVQRPGALAAAAAHLERRLGELGYAVEKQVFEVDGVPCTNLWGEIAGAATPGEIVVVGAHYDSCFDSPGANDNGSGVAATLALAEHFRDRTPGRTLRFVLFVNEEPPYFTTPDMGSLRFARRCRDRDEDVVAMLSIETIGYYDDTRGSQKYPPPLGLVYPTTGDFIAFVGNVRSRRLVRRCIGRFRAAAAFPSEGGAIVGWVPGVGWSDHWSFWKAGYPGVMVTDTAPFRYPHYHLTSDTPDKLDYDRTARVVAGLAAVVEDLAGSPSR